jgi:DNA-binding beta-propeller fold protein YncE
VAVAATSDARSPRLGEDAVLIFDPRRAALAQPIRRVHVGAAPVAVAVGPAGKVAAAALLTSAEIARVDLAQPPGVAAAVTRQKTCAEPILLEFAEASRLLLVGCRGGAALSLHDAASLAESARLDLGGPALSIDVAPDGRQALVVVGPPVNAVSVVDLSSRSLRRLEIGDEIASARYARHGERAAAFSLRGHRAWVLR